MKLILKRAKANRAFTLLEVMIAMGIFFMASFSILGIVSNCLRNARLLQRPQVDASMAAAQVYLTLSTNKNFEPYMSGDLNDMVPGYSWTANVYEFSTNGILQADISVTHRGTKEKPDTLSILVFDQNFQMTPTSGRPR
jgi:Tfp pilus assembly protein PilV